jgi:hypothetical protein
MCRLMLLMDARSSVDACGYLKSTFPFLRHRSSESRTPRYLRPRIDRAARLAALLAKIEAQSAAIAAQREAAAARRCNAPGWQAAGETDDGMLKLRFVPARGAE